MLGGNKLPGSGGDQELNNYAVKAHAIYTVQAQSPTGSSPGFCLQVYDMG